MAKLAELKKQEEKKMNETDLIPYSRITRVEVIGTHGRELVKHDVTDVQISIQDDGQTLKLFLKDKQNV